MGLGGGGKAGERGGEERPGRETDGEELLLKEGRHFGEAGKAGGGRGRRLRDPTVSSPVWPTSRGLSALPLPLSLFLSLFPPSSFSSH